MDLGSIPRSIFIVPWSRLRRRVGFVDHGFGYRYSNPLDSAFCKAD